jgi:hypothetical protein
VACGPYHALELADITPEHVLIEKHNRIERLILRRGRHPPIDRKVCQKRLDFGSPHLVRMALLVKEDVPLDPMDIRFFCADAVVPDPNGLAKAIEQARFL